jgi:hypothetical protein
MSFMLDFMIIAFLAKVFGGAAMKCGFGRGLGDLLPSEQTRSSAPVLGERGFGGEKRKLIAPFNEHLDAPFATRNVTFNSLRFKQCQIETYELRLAAGKLREILHLSGYVLQNSLIAHAYNESAAQHRDQPSMSGRLLLAQSTMPCMSRMYPIAVH